MGNFYVNFTVKTDNPEAVVDSLRKNGRKAFVTPPKDGFVVVFEAQSEGQNDQAIEAVGESLSQSLNCPVLGILNHDDDVLGYWLYEGGSLVDAYNSFPGYFDGNLTENRGGNAELLCELLGKPGSGDVIQRVLHQENYAFALWRHEELCKALSLPTWAVGVSYRNVQRETGLPDLPVNNFGRHEYAS